MVEFSSHERLSAADPSRCRFESCKYCPLVDECELIQEYEQFRSNHPKPVDEQPASVISDDTLVIQGIAIPSSSEDDDIPYGVPEQSYPTCATEGSRFDIDFPSYDEEELEIGCIMSGTYVYPRECGRQSVTEGIGDHFKIETYYDGSIKTDVEDRWEPLQPVFISAQTGQGKNYFIENTLIPYVRDLNYKNRTNQKVLILSNRLALLQQVKSHLKGAVGDDDDDGEDKIYPYRDCADVMSYQSLLGQEKYLETVQKKKHSRYIYIICDEAHFFTSDAMFNPHTSKILSAIVRLFRDAVRVYMSATPYECLKYIIDYEQKYQNVLNFGKAQGKYRPSQMIFYHFQRDYSYLDVKSYSSIDELFEIIVASVNKRKEKWLIFIDDKERGSLVKAKLLKCAREYAKEHGGSQILNGEVGEEDESEDKDQILVVNAESKADKTYTMVIKNEKLGKNTYVLISTSVLDNGVNLAGINNIVVSDMSKVKCLQMVGRARVSGSNDRKTLYVKRFGDNEVDKRIKNLYRQRDAYQRYNLAYAEPRDLMRPRGNNEWIFLKKYYDGTARDWEDAKHWFGRSMDDPKKLYFNEVAESLMGRMIPQYQAIYDEMIEEGQALDEAQRSEGVNYTGQKYLEYQLAWFGKSYSVDDDITFADKEKAKKEFIAFLEVYAESGKIIETEEKMEEFQEKFTRLHDMAYTRADKNRDRIYKFKKMNDLLNEHGLKYVIDGKPQAGPWTIKRADSNESPE